MMMLKIFLFLLTDRVFQKSQYINGMTLKKINVLYIKFNLLIELDWDEIKSE